VPACARAGRKIEQAERGLACQLEAEETARAASEELRQRFEETAEEVSRIEDALRAMRSDLGLTRDKTGHAELKLSEARMRLDHQAETVRERWTVDIDQWRLPTLSELVGGDAEESADAAEARGEGPDARAEIAAEISSSEEGDSSREDAEQDDDADAAVTPVSAQREARRNLELALLRPSDSGVREGA
jgi:hypothetical protein